ncbi:MAG: AMP-binding protein [Clostridia bacterium]|nr:AMP-binding protein [Clostridia bacterium]
MRTYNNLKPVAKPKLIENFRQLVRTNAEAFGDKAQFIYPENGKRIEKSFNEMYSDIMAFTTALFCKGLAGKNVAVIGDLHPAWMTAFHSVVIGGGVIVPLDHELDPEQAANFMKIAKCSAVVYTSAMNKKIEEAMPYLDFIEYFIPVSADSTGDRVVPFCDFIAEGNNAIAAGDTRFNDAEIDMEKMCALFFTSGTTGTSKGVMLSQKNIVAAANASCNSTQYGMDDVFVSVLPIHHTYELVPAQISATNLGATVFICDGIRYATKRFQEEKPTCLVLVPLFLETIHKKIWAEIRRKGIEKKVRAAMKISDSLLKIGVDNRDKFFAQVTAVFGGRLKSIVVGGAPLDPQIVKDFYSFGITVVQGYGITECSPLVAVNRPGKVMFDSVGQPVDCCEVKIVPLDDSENGDGEILVRGDNVMLGYYENPEATKAAFTSDGWFRTGDIGTMDKNGYIKITGRLKNVIIASNGKNVFPEELEERLNRLTSVRECIVLSRDNAEGNQEIVAVIVPDYEVLGEGTSDAAASMIFKEAIAQINRTLPSYKHIDRFEIRHEDFEKTLTKKIKRFLIK